MLQRKGKLKGKTKDTRLALFCIFAQILVSLGDFLSIERINFKKSLHFTKSSFTRKLLCKEHQSKHHAVRLSSSSLTSQKICDIVLVALEYRCLSRFSRSRRGRLGTLHTTGKMLFFFPLLFLSPCCFQEEFL
jgi:hypothetical protein